MAYCLPTGRYRARLLNACGELVSTGPNRRLRFLDPRSFALGWRSLLAGQALRPLRDGCLFLLRLLWTLRRACRGLRGQVWLLIWGIIGQPSQLIQGLLMFKLGSRCSPSSYRIRCSPVAGWNSTTSPSNHGFPESPVKRMLTRRPTSISPTDLPTKPSTVPGTCVLWPLARQPDRSNQYREAFRFRYSVSGSAAPGCQLTLLVVTASAIRL